MSQSRTIPIGALSRQVSPHGHRFCLPSLLIVSLVSLISGCVNTSPECGGAEVSSTISGLFRKQLKLTPYVRYIDFNKSELDVEAIFSVKEDRASRSCVAFVRYNAKLNDQGQAATGRNDLSYSLLFELANEKQVYYKVSRASDGHVDVKIERVGG